VAQQLAFEAPQHPFEPSSPASAKLAMLIAASIAPVNLIHRIEERLLPLGISNLGRPDPRNTGVGQSWNSRRLNRAACDARRNSNGWAITLFRSQRPSNVRRPQNIGRKRCHLGSAIPFKVAPR